MKQVTFELTWNEINDAIADYVREKADKVLEPTTSLPTQAFISFYDRNGKQIGVDGASIMIKAY